MSNLEQSFRTWVAAQTVCGAHATPTDGGDLRFSPGLVSGFVSFVPFVHGERIVELRMQRDHSAKPSFLTRFVLEDEWRARALFREMARALEAENVRGAARVLVCCSAETSTLLFVDKLRAAAEQLSIAYEFVPMPVEEALAARGDYAAVMLAPQVAHLQQEAHRAYPDAVTFSIPRTVFAAGDGRTAVRLLLEALGEVDTICVNDHCLVPARALPGEGTVLVLNVMYCDRCVRLGYNVWTGAHLRVRGKVTKALLSMQDIDDLLATLPLEGVAVGELDAIGFVMPGVVNFCSMNLPSLGDRDYCLAEKIEKRYGIPVYMDNNTNAAAMGCHLLDAEHDSLTLYRHQLGHKAGGQGTVIGDTVVRGLHGMAGEPKFYQRRFKYTVPYVEGVWSAEGLAEICQNVLLASIGTVSPEVAYLAVSGVDDMDAIRCALERQLPQYCIPELVAVHDYRERMYLGEVGLCLQRLASR